MWLVGSAGPRTGTSAPRHLGSRVSTQLTDPKPEDRSRSRAAGSEAAAIGRRVREAEKEMLQLERRRDRVRDALTATVDYVELTKLGNELDAVQAVLDVAEEAWLALALEAQG